MNGQQLGYIVGTIIMPFVLSYVILWVVSKLSKKNLATRRNVIIGGIILLVLSFLGRAGHSLNTNI